jgi:hypothetical protein
VAGIIGTPGRLQLEWVAAFARNPRPTSSECAAERYLGRICHYRECHPRVACRALSCGRRQHLNDDLQIVTLSPTLVSAPPIDLWPRIIARCAVPTDTHALLVAKLDDAARES